MWIDRRRKRKKGRVVTDSPGGGEGRGEQERKGGEGSHVKYPNKAVLTCSWSILEAISCSLFFISYNGCSCSEAVSCPAGAERSNWALQETMLTPPLAKNKYFHTSSQTSGGSNDLPLHEDLHMCSEYLPPSCRQPALLPTACPCSPKEL